MNTKRLLAASFIILSLLSYMDCRAQFKNVTINVTNESMQEFDGLGFSIHKGKAYFLPDDPAKLEYLYSETFRSFNTVVFWSYIEAPEYRDRFIEEAVKHGLKRVIVNPTGYPTSPQDHAQTVFSNIKEYMNAGYPIYGTTIMNKPNTDESDTYRQTPTFLTECAKLLRFKLDSAGYNHIKIGGPSTIEWDPYIDPTDYGAAHGYGFVPGDNQVYLDAIINDPDALNVIDAFDFQSYGWSISNSIQEQADQHNKDLWVTLSATDGKNNNNGDPILGPISAATILANINHGVSTWSHWVWDQLANFSTGQPNKRMRIIQQIGDNFREGASVRRVLADESQVSENMFWNYYDIMNPANNLQPEIIASACWNTDNKLAVGLVNLTGIHAQHFASVYVASEAAVYNVDLVIEDLGPNDIGLFNVTYTSPDGSSREGDQILVKHSLTHLSILSQDLAVAVSDSIKYGVQVLTAADAPGNLISSLNEDGTVALDWVDPSSIEDGFIIQRREKGASEYTELLRVSPNTTSFQDNDTETGKEYEYLVSAYKEYDFGQKVITDTISGNTTEIYITPVGIINPITENLTVYPNPTNGLIRFNMDRYPSIAQVRIYTQQGALVFNETANPREQIDLSRLKDGLYTGTISNSMGSAPFKIVIMK